MSTLPRANRGRTERREKARRTLNKCELGLFSLSWFGQAFGVFASTMAAKNESHGSKATPSKESLSSRARDGRKATHNDSSTESDNKPPNHGRNTNGPGRFLEWVGRKRDRIDGFDPALSELGELYRQWSDGDTEQADLAGWSE